MLQHITALQQKLDEQGSSSNAARESDIFTLHDVLEADAQPSDEVIDAMVKEIVRIKVLTAPVAKQILLKHLRP